MCYSVLGMDTQAQPQVPNPIAPIVDNLPKGGIKKVWPFIVGAFLVVAVGVGAGWFMTKDKGSSSVAPGAKSGDKVAGIEDTSTFKDSAEGVLEEGGINGEGQYHLTRDGGVSQNVYLTSTAVDLSNFVGKKVKVQGQTIAGKKAGWLMDVGKVTVVE